MVQQIENDNINLFNPLKSLQDCKGHCQPSNAGIPVVKLSCFLLMTGFTNEQIFLACTAPSHHPGGAQAQRKETQRLKEKFFTPKQT